MPLYHYVETVTNRTGDVLPGYYIRLRDPDLALATLYSDSLRTPIIGISGLANAAKTDDNGRVSIWVEDGYRAVEIYDRTETDLLIDSIPDVSMISATVNFQYYVSAPDTYLTVGTSPLRVRLPHDYIVTEIRASLVEAATGANVIVDINVNGSSILSTKLTIDAGEKTSTTAAIPAVISTSSIVDDSELTFDIDQIGSTLPGTGLLVTLIGVRS